MTTSQSALMNRIDTIKKNIIFILIIFLTISHLAAVYGSKYIRHYDRKEYKSQPQNWNIVQDRRGIIYVANQGAVLEYDGCTWKEILIPGKNVRSLAVEKNERGLIYVGGNNEIGRLTPAAHGPPHYSSLTGLISREYRQFGHVWRTYWTNYGVYFCASKYIFLLREDKINVWQAETLFSPPLLWDNTLYIRQKGVGLSVLRQGKLYPLPWGDGFKKESMFMLAGLNSGALLAGVRQKGFLLYKDNKTRNIESPDIDQAVSANIRFGMLLSDGTVALATANAGVFIVDINGTLIHRFSTANGMEDDNVSSLFEDRQGNLWLAQVNRIAKIEYRTPFSFFNASHHLPGLIMTVIRHGLDNRLFAGSDSGLYIYKKDGFFSQVPGIPGICYDLLSAEETLLAATDKGIFAINDDTLKGIKLSTSAAFMFYKSKSGKWPLLAGTSGGIVKLSRYSPELPWQVSSFLDTVDDPIRTITEDNTGSLWMSSLKKGAIKVSNPQAPVIRHIELPMAGLGETHVYFAAGHIILATGKGIFAWDETKEAFSPDLTLGSLFAGSEQGRGVKLIEEDDIGRIWFHSRARNLMAMPGPDGKYRVFEKVFLRIPFNAVNQIFPDPLTQDIWLASADGLFRIDGHADFKFDSMFSTYIRDVSANETPVINSRPEPVLPFDRRSLRFSFAAPFFHSEENTLYRCKLEGYDREWTAWSTENRKDYTNLDPGLNIFNVQAKNIYGDISKAATFRFKLLPPWYRTWWAYSFYVIVLIAIIFLFIRWRLRQLEREKQNLEQIIHQRTREIEDKNLLLQDQSEKLKELDTLKSRFFANISHEFRTPLTLIMGPLEQMLAQCGDNEKEKKQRLELMIRNAQRLLRLINQLLDLSKLDGGKLKLRAVKTTIIPFLKTLTSSFELLSQRDNLTLEFLADEEINDLEIYIDHPRMEDVMSNLLINAFKFTPHGGTIGVTVSKTNNMVRINVRDTGPGIPERELDRVFDRFFQADGTYKTQQKGTGIGLALARELVELHHGTLTVSSKEGAGSCFTILLPLGSAHLHDDEISDTVVSPTHGSLSVSAAAAGQSTNDLTGGQPGIEPEAAETPDEFDDEQNEKKTEEAKEIILVVEDNADVRTYIRSTLDPLYRVLEASDGAEGLKMAHKAIPDLVISDVMMPEMDGYELCAQLKQDKATSHIPVILLTAKASEASVVEGLQTGADDYVTKPFSTAILLARIKNLIDLRRHLQLTLHRELTGRPVELEVSAIDREFLTDLKQVIEANIDDPDFNVEALCDKLYMSRPTVYRKIQALSGESPTEFIRSFRLNRAAKLLEQNFGSVLDVALEVGFSSASYFTKCFRKKFDQLPSTYQAQ